MVLAVASVSAQYRDTTMTFQDTAVYMINPVTNCLSNRAGSGVHFAGLLLQQFVPHNRVTVYGIAITMRDPRSIDSIYQNPKYTAVLMQRAPGATDSVHYASYATVTYRTLRYLDSVQLDSTQHVGLNYTKFRYEFTCPNKTYVTVPCYEFYFDRPWVMTDTFYVGRKYYYQTSDSITTPSEHVGVDEDPIPPYPFWYNGWSDTTMLCDYTAHMLWGFVFPIIGFHCKPLDERSHTLLLTDQTNDGATVHWYSEEEGATYNVRVVSADGSVDSMVVTTDSSYTFHGLPYNKRYSVQVRKQCYYATASYDTTVYSPWTTTSANTTFTLGVDTTGTGGGSGIDTTGGGGGGGGIDTSSTGIVMVGDAGFGLSPNPVHGVVEVTLERPLEADGMLTLYDMGGREVRRMAVPAGSRKVAFDTEGCPAGAYLLKLLTPQGVASRRLVVN